MGTTSPAASAEWLRSLLNTADLYNGVDELLTGLGATQRLRTLRMLPPDLALDDADAEQVREARERLRDLAASNTTQQPVDPAHLQALGGRLSAGRLRIHLEVADPLAVRLVAERDNALALVLGGTAAALHELVLTGTWPRFKACANSECRWAFYDRSRSCTGRWCDMGACGNLMKARAYRRRRRSGPERP